MRYISVFVRSVCVKPNNSKTHDLNVNDEASAELYMPAAT